MCLSTVKYNKQCVILTDQTISLEKLYQKSTINNYNLYLMIFLLQLKTRSRRKNNQIYRNLNFWLFHNYVRLQAVNIIPRQPSCVMISHRQCTIHRTHLGNSFPLYYALKLTQMKICPNPITYCIIKSSKYKLGKKVPQL